MHWFPIFLPDNIFAMSGFRIPYFCRFIFLQKLRFYFCFLLSAFFCLWIALQKLVPIFLPVHFSA